MGVKRGVGLMQQGMNEKEGKKDAKGIRADGVSKSVQRKPG